MIRKILTILTILSASTDCTHLQSKYATSSQNYHRHDGSLSYNYAVVHENRPRDVETFNYHPIQYASIKSSRNDPRTSQRYNYKQKRPTETKRLKISSQKPVAFNLYLDPRIMGSEGQQYQQYTTAYNANTPLPKNQPMENTNVKSADDKNNQVPITNYVFTPKVNREFHTLPHNTKHDKPSLNDRNQYTLAYWPLHYNKEQPKSLQEQNADYEKTQVLYQQVPRLRLNVARSYIANTPKKAPPAAQISPYTQDYFVPSPDQEKILLLPM